MDTKFSVAVHILIMISESPDPMNSSKIAKSVGTNASYIRKITALLKKCGIVDGHKGISGCKLVIAPDKITLLEIYKAVSEESKVHLFDVHQNINDKCIVGKFIRPVLSGMFESIEKDFSESLNNKTLADCINEMRSRVRKSN